MTLILFNAFIPLPASFKEKVGILVHGHVFIKYSGFVFVALVDCMFYLFPNLLLLNAYGEWSSFELHLCFTQILQSQLLANKICWLQDMLPKNDV